MRLWTFRNSKRINADIGTSLAEIRDTRWHDHWTGCQVWIENRATGLSIHLVPTTVLALRAPHTYRA